LPRGALAVGVPGAVGWLPGAGNEAVAVPGGSARRSAVGAAGGGWPGEPVWPGGVAGWSAEPALSSPVVGEAGGLSGALPAWPDADPPGRPGRASVEPVPGFGGVPPGAGNEAVVLPRPADRRGPVAPVVPVAAGLPGASAP